MRKDGIVKIELSKNELRKIGRQLLGIKSTPVTETNVSVAERQKSSF